MAKIREPYFDYLETVLKRDFKTLGLGSVSLTVDRDGQLFRLTVQCRKLKRWRYSDSIALVNRTLDRVLDYPERIRVVHVTVTA